MPRAGVGTRECLSWLKTQCLVSNIALYTLSALSPVQKPDIEIHDGKMVKLVKKGKGCPQYSARDRDINRDNYKDEIHLVNRSLIRKYLRYGLKSIFLTFNNLDKNLETPGKLL